MIKRETSDQEGICLVAAKRPFPSAGNVYKVKGYFTAKTTFSLILLRKTEQGYVYVCVWRSSPLSSEGPGLKILELETPLSVQKDDLFGFYFAGKVGVYYNPATGDYLELKKDIPVGEQVQVNRQKAVSKYSMGVEGIL